MTHPFFLLLVGILPFFLPQQYLSPSCVRAEPRMYDTLC